MVLICSSSQKAKLQNMQLCFCDNLLPAQVISYNYTLFKIRHKSEGIVTKGSKALYKDNV